MKHHGNIDDTFKLIITKLDLKEEYIGVHQLVWKYRENLYQRVGLAGRGDHQIQFIGQSMTQIEGQSNSKSKSNNGISRMNMRNIRRYKQINEFPKTYKRLPVYYIDYKWKQIIASQTKNIQQQQSEQKQQQQYTKNNNAKYDRQYSGQQIQYSLSYHQYNPYIYTQIQQIKIDANQSGGVLVIKQVKIDPFPYDQNVMYTFMIIYGCILSTQIQQQHQQQQKQYNNYQWDQDLLDQVNQLVFTNRTETWRQNHYHFS